MGFSMRPMPSGPRNDACSSGRVRTDAASGEDPADRVRPPGGGGTERSAGKQAGDLQLPGLYDDLRQVATRQVSAVAEIPARSVAGEALAVKEELRRRMHQPIPRQGEWLRGGHRVAQIPRGADQHPLSPDLPRLRDPTLAALATAARPARQDHVGADEAAGRRLPAEAAHPSSRPEQTFAVKHPRWEPYAGKPLVRFCAGGAQ